MSRSVCLLFMKARERRTASSGWRVDTGQRAGKASLLVLRENKGKESMLVDLSELGALCDMPSSQRVKRYEVAVGRMPPAPR